jgi:hypothetical protein
MAIKITKLAFAFGFATSLSSIYGFLNKLFK